MEEMKLLSLFDGSGGFPLAASMCGITPVMAAEVEPYPIAVTKSHFPHMKHLGNVKIIITIKRRLARQFTFAIFVVTALVPHRVAAVKVIADVIRYICDNKLRLRYVIPFEVLKVIVKKFAFHFLHRPAVFTANITVGADISITATRVDF